MDLHNKIMNIEVDEETIKKCIIKEIEKLPYWAITEDMEMDYIRKDFVKEVLQKYINSGIEMQGIKPLSYLLKQRRNDND